MATPPTSFDTAIPPTADGSRGRALPTIDDEFMNDRLSKAQNYALVLLKRTPKLTRPEVDPIIWEHGRRNMALEQAGLMPIVCPVRDESEWAGFCVLPVSLDCARAIFNEDPGVKAGIFTFEVHPVAGFPGSALSRQEDATRG